MSVAARILNDHNTGRRHNPEGNLGPFARAFRRSNSPDGRSPPERLVPPPDQGEQTRLDTQGGEARPRPINCSGTQQVPTCVREAAERCGLGKWAGRQERRTERNSHGEERQHWWWRFERPGAATCGPVELFHGCCVEVAKLAVHDGVLPGPRQGSRRKATPAAFAAV